VERLYQCAQEHPAIAVITKETNPTGLAATTADLSLWFGEPPHGITAYAISIGSDQIVIIAGDEVPLESLNQEQLLRLFTNTNTPYQVWTYGEDSDLGRLFEQSVLQGVPVSRFALLAPNPGAMVEAISQDPRAVGYLPVSWLTEDLKTISIVDELKATLTHPILVLSAEEPTGNLYAFLVCLQAQEP
jgi:ABC-type phosphate transport system substrate-binding protein